MLNLIITNDGSHSLKRLDGVTYHSIHGAIQESMHIFIRAGLEPLLACSTRPLAIFELGLGTGLNALLTAIAANASGRPIHYEAVESSPLEPALTAQLNYAQHLPPAAAEILNKIHLSEWGKQTQITPGFKMLKVQAKWPDHQLSQPADLVYYDAFDPSTQPECWTPAVFAALFGQLAPGAILVTFCCAGVVRRALLAAGFLVEKLPGPPGKREMLRAKKPN